MHVKIFIFFVSCTHPMRNKNISKTNTTKHKNKQQNLMPTKVFKFCDFNFGKS